MKKTLSLLFLALASYFGSNATTYYFSASGNDANAGTSTSAPWKTITKLNSFFSSLKAGDNVLLNRGEVFYGSITVSKSGSSGSPIIIGAYGTGADPVITGFTTVSVWSNLGSNIWESTSAVSSLTSCNLVSFNGVAVAMGRYPSTGYLTYQSFLGNTSITSSSLGATNWTGAEAVIRKNDWTIDRAVINSFSGTTLTFSDPYTPDYATAGYGFFIQNDVRTLTYQNAWYYNPSTKKIRVYSTSTPSNAQVATVSNLLTNNGYSYITIDNITFTGASNNAINFPGGVSNNCYIQNSTISLCGQNGIYLTIGSNNVINNNIINNCNAAGIEVDAGTGNSFTNNVISNIGIIKGQAYSASHGDGIYTSSTSPVIKYNTIKNVAYDGIFVSYAGGAAMIQYNYVDSNNVVLDDGGGIYTAANDANVRTIDHNIILNAIGNREGTTNLTRTLCAGIYLDELASNVVITNNTTANCSAAGIKIHKGSYTTINNNTSYNNASWQIYFQNETTTPYIYKTVMKNNVFVARKYSSSTQYQYVIGFTTNANDISSFGTADSNYYSRPLNDNSTLSTYQANTSWVNRALASWQSFTGQDAHSHASPKAITDTNDLLLVYNTTSANKIVSLSYKYIDVKNVSYNGSITLAPYSSAVLIKNGALTSQPPVANAGVDQVITLPTASVTLTGSGTDANGTISSYGWTKISGPTSGTITSATSASTTVTALIQGIYQFQLKVTDNSGLTGLDTVQITVNAASTLLPAVNPANTVNGLNYSYYQSSGIYTALPNFTTTTPTSTGTVTNFVLTPETRTTNIAFNYTGYISVPADGQYTFYAVSDDGSSIYIDNVLVVNNDGVHGYLSKTGTIGLQAGKHAISVGYFNQTGTSIFQVSYAGPTIAKTYVPPSSLYRVSTGIGLDLSNNSISSSDLLTSNQPVIKAYPNPFVNSINVNITGAAGDYKLTLVDVIGRVIWTKAGMKDSGTYQELITTSSLQRGIYLLNVIQNGKSSAIKIEK